MLITFLFLSSRQMPILAWQPACLPDGNQKAGEKGRMYGRDYCA